MIVLAKTHSSLNVLGDVQEECPTWIINNVHEPEWDPIQRRFCSYANNFGVYFNPILFYTIC